MPSSASQATGAARAHSQNVRRRKAAAVGLLLDELLDPPGGRAAMADAVAAVLLELSEPRLRRLMYEAGFSIDVIDRHLR
jgi:hypothetical protein